jgi:ATP-dependent helicase HrpA
VLAESRDVGSLLRQHQPRARDALKDAAPHSAWERRGITSWDFGDLPEFVTRTVLGSEIRAYPALLDRQSSVELALLESARAAQLATLGGVTRLLSLASRRPLGALVDSLPGAFPQASGVPVSRAENAAFRERVLARIVLLAFELGEGSVLPRCKADFERLVSLGTPRIAPAFRAVCDAVAAASAELGRTLLALNNAAKHPSGKAVVQEVRAQLAQLFPADLVSTVELPRLEQFPRYLRAAQTRLARAVTDPRRDAEKLAPFAPHWAAFLDKRTRASDQGAATALRWAFEELRVAIFAPELKPAMAVSVASIAAALSALR